MPAGKKSEAQREAVALKLARGWSIQRAAKDSGVGERTIRGWLGDAAFAGQVRALRGRLLTRTVARLTAAGSKAVRTLVELAAAADKDSTRVSAADKILSHAFRGAEMVELEERVAALEAAKAATTVAKEAP